MPSFCMANCDPSMISRESDRKRIRRWVVLIRRLLGSMRFAEKVPGRLGTVRGQVFVRWVPSTIPENKMVGEAHPTIRDAMSRDYRPWRRRSPRNGSSSEIS